MTKTRRIRRNGAGWHAVLIPLAALWSIPLIMIIGISFMPASNPRTTAFGLLPSTPDLSNYIKIWTQNPLFEHFINSLIIAVPSVIGVVFFGSMAAYALAMLRVPYKPLIFALLVLGLVLPMSGIVVAVFQILVNMGLYNNLIGITLTYTALGLPFAIIIVRTAYQGVPRELYEAAKVDGAGWWRIFWKIYFPLGRPALAVVIIWQTMLAWNDFLLPLVVLESQELKPLTLVPLAYRGMYQSQPGALFAILFLISIPVVVVFLLVQRYLVAGLAGAVK